MEVVSACSDLVRLSDGVGVGVRRRDTVQTHLGSVCPRLFEIPEFDAFEGTFAGEFDDVVTSSEYASADDALLAGAIAEVDHQAVKKNRFTGDAHLNGAKGPVATGELDATVVPVAFDLGGS